MIATVFAQRVHCKIFKCNILQKNSQFISFYSSSLLQNWRKKNNDDIYGIPALFSVLSKARFELAPSEEERHLKPPPWTARPSRHISLSHHWYDPSHKDNNITPCHNNSCTSRGKTRLQNPVIVYRSLSPECKKKKSSGDAFWKDRWILYRCIRQEWNCRQSGSNRRPLDYETNATTNCAIAATRYPSTLHMCVSKLSS